ncbi:MAG TPA: helix-turn-helix domain-containing protein [Longimicrobiales bacterium]|nr:helix-turn-helix domain-containing protein [Longimicrobiales bacterium]
MSSAASTRFMTTGEAAAYLRLAERTLQDMRLKGTGPAYFKLGPGKRSKVVYQREDLDAWVTQYQFRSTSEYGSGT